MDLHWEKLITRICFCGFVPPSLPSLVETMPVFIGKHPLPNSVCPSEQCSVATFNLSLMNNRFPPQAAALSVCNVSSPKREERVKERFLALLSSLLSEISPRFTPLPLLALHHTFLKVDLGHGAKPAGYYVQRSYGLFPAPWPQDSDDLTRICHLFELLGLFVAKCIQDGRRVDLPLSRPFFKLMCSSAKSQSADHVTLSESKEQLSSTHEEAEPESPLPDSNEEENENSISDSTQSNQQQTSRSGSSIGSGIDTASADRVRSGMEAGLKEAELLVNTSQAEISKDGSSKDVVTLEELSVRPLTSVSGGNEGAWFDGILDNEDFAEVNPFRAKFLDQLDKLVQQRDAILSDSTLEAGEREKRLAAVTLPGEQENLPGMKLQDLW